jgi:serine/threonine protein kinase
MDESWRISEKQKTLPGSSAAYCTVSGEGMSYLQSDDVKLVHNDLKPDNVLLNCKHPDVTPTTLCVRLGDFGIR